MRNALVLIVFVATSSNAQMCHEPAPTASLSLGLQVSLRSEFATYKIQRFVGEYQGLAVGLAWERSWLKLRAVIPGYRLTTNGLERFGLGDLLVDARFSFAVESSHTLRWGPSLAATLPTGDASRELGMGHVMLMPGLWAVWNGPRAFVQSQLSYGRGLGSSATHHLSGPSPIVNPMNVSEMEMAMTAGYTVIEQLRVRGGFYGAVPVAAPQGAARAAAFVGADLTLLERIDLSAEAHVPVIGDPFLAKLVIAVAARF